MPDTHSVSNPSLRLRLGAFLASARVQQFIIGLIVINAVLMGLETSPALMAQYGSTLLAFDRAILVVFVLEIALRLYVHRAAFFRDPWSLFDFAVVGIALIPASGPFAVLRALRVLRVLRTPRQQRLMNRSFAALFAAAAGLLATVKRAAV